MSLPQISIIRISDAQNIALPYYGNPVGTSMTLQAANIDAVKIAPNHFQLIDTGLAIALPIGLEAQVRSLKQSSQTGVFVLNAPLTIDASDRCEIKVCLYNASNESVIIKNKDPIALLVFSPAVRVQWNDLSFDMTRYHTSDQNEPVQTKQEKTPEEPLVQQNLNESSSVQKTEDAPMASPKVLTTPPVEPQIQPETKPNEPEPPAIIKQFENLENHFYDTHTDEHTDGKDPSNNA